MGLRRTLAASSGAVTIMVVTGFIVPLVLTLRTVAYDQATSAAALEARSIAQVLLTNPGPSVAESVVQQANSESGRRVQLVLPGGGRVGDSIAGGADLKAALRGASVVARFGAGAIIDIPVRLTDGVWVVRVQVPPSQTTQGLELAWVILALVGLGLVLLAIVVGDRLARQITRPVADLEEVATTLSEGHLDVRAAVQGPKEIQSVAIAVNELGARIAALVQAEREAAADLSHRLRTPLTALRLHLETVEDPSVREQLVADSTAIAAAIDEIIRVVRASPPTDDACDLAATVKARMRFWRVLAEAQHRRVTLEVPARSVIVTVPSAELEAALDALVANVLTHTPEPAALDVTVNEDASHCSLLVEDRGPGLDASLLERGLSGDGGTGLGLDIARRTAERGGGTFAVAARAGGGASVRLSFPRRDAPPNASSGASSPSRSRRPRLAANN